MSDNDFDWLDDHNSSSSTRGRQSTSKRSSRSSSSQREGGGWHAALTLLTLPLTVAACFLMAYLTRAMDARGALLLGCTFAVPAIVVLVTAYLLEVSTSYMTPSTSRNQQLALVGITVVLCFIIGCFGEVTGNMTFTKVPEPTATPAPTATVEPVVTHAYNYILLLDKSYSMHHNDEKSVNATKELLDQTADGTYVGIVVFCDEILSTVDITPLDASRRALIHNAIDVPVQRSTSFSKTLDRAIEMLKENTVPNDYETRILLITDGADDISNDEVTTFTNQCKTYNASISVLRIDADIRTSLAKLVKDTNGMDLLVTDIAMLHENLVIASQINLTPKPTMIPTPTPEPIVITDVIREIEVDKTDADNKWISIVMLLTQGIVLGIALSVMMSRQGQKRFQFVLSILMGAAATCIMCFVDLPLSQIWIKEALAFSCYGVVIMKKNR